MCTMYNPGSGPRNSQPSPFKIWIAASSGIYNTLLKVESGRMEIETSKL